MIKQLAFRFYLIILNRALRQPTKVLTQDWRPVIMSMNKDTDNLASRVVTSVSKIAKVDEDIKKHEQYMARIQNLLSIADGDPTMEEYRSQLRVQRARVEEQLGGLRRERTSLESFIAESGFGHL